MNETLMRLQLKDAHLLTRINKWRTKHVSQSTIRNIEHAKSKSK